MEKMVIVVQLTKEDTRRDICKLLIQTMDDLNNRGYAVLGASADGEEVFGDMELNKEFLSRLD